MEEVLDVYARPYNKECPVVCYDESPKQLLSEIRSYMDENGVKYQDAEYKREGATEIVMIVEPLGGQRQVLVQDDQRNNNQRGVDWQFKTSDARIKLKRIYPTIIT